MRGCAVLLAAACGGRSGFESTRTDEQGAPDASNRDSGAEMEGIDGGGDSGPAPGAEGSWCDPALSGEDGQNPGCAEGAICAEIDERSGICLTPGCSVDLIATTTNEDSCGSGYACIDLDGLFDDEEYDRESQPDGQNLDRDDNVCVRKCTPHEDSNECDDGLACAPDTTRYHFAQPVCFAPACESGRDCPVTVSASGTCARDGDCGEGQFCSSFIDTDGDGVLDRGACAVPGVCNAASGLCDPHTLGGDSAMVGDPCQSDMDCQMGGTCLLAPGRGGWGLDAVPGIPRNGYCTLLGCRFSDTLPGRHCPTGSSCSQFYWAGGCQRRCSAMDPTGCRGNDCDPAAGVTRGCDWYGDYDCYDWTGWFFATGLPVVDGLDGYVCDYIGPLQLDCETMQISSAGQGCSALAPTGNPVDMQCRDPESAMVTASPSDPNGSCLDTTPSGPPCADYGRFCDGECIDTGGRPCPGG